MYTETKPIRETMNRHLRIWTSLLNQRIGRANTKALINQIKRQHRRLQASQPKQLNQFLQAQWDNLIAPGLALYRTLLAEGTPDQQAVLQEVESLLKASFFIRERRLVKVLNRLQDPFPLVRLALRRMTTNHYLPGASEAIEDNQDCFAVITRRCFILDTLTEYGAPELAPLYCKTDDWLAEALPKVRWLRTQTLANGGELCDFRWCRQQQASGDNHV